MPISSKGSVLLWTGLVVSHLSVASGVLAQGLSFIARRDFAVGSRPTSVAVGDFNGDGVEDLVVATDVASGTVSVLLANGNGIFQAARNFPVGRFPYSVAVDDFNGDGFQDVAVANYGSNSVSVLLGNGDGTLQVARDFPVGSQP